MSNHQETKREEKPDFRWGSRLGVGRTNKEICFYDSFTYDGNQYALYDNVYLHNDDEPEPFIGKLVKIYEMPTHEKKVTVVWYFRPIEIDNFLKGYEASRNEIFLATGEGVGVSNRIALESIIGKCNVICASNNSRNPRPSKEELHRADYIFNRTFDVGKLKLQERFPEKIYGIKVEHFFNKLKGQRLNYHTKPRARVRPIVRKSILSPRAGQDKALEGSNSSGRLQLVVKESKRPANDVDKQGCFPSDTTTMRAKTSVGNSGSGPAKISSSQVQTGAEVGFPEDITTRTMLPFKKRKVFQNERTSMEQFTCGRSPKTDVKYVEKRKVSQDEKAKREQFTCHRSPKTDSKYTEVTTNTSERSWFKQLPWEERLQRADEAGTLLTFENLDPSFTSSEVEDLVWHALKRRVEAKMIQRDTFSSPHYGAALVIFKSKDAADVAMSELRRRCLLLSDGRPVIVSRGSIPKPSKPNSLVGHLVLDKLVHRKQQTNMKEAVSTSHCAQSNTIEFEMAMPWCLLQERSDIGWKELYKKQEREIQQLRSRLRMNQDDYKEVEDIRAVHGNYWKP